MHTYAISSQKGGVGKTTTAINLGAALALEGKRVLLVDFDPQGSLTAAVGKRSGIITLGDVLMDPNKILNAISPCTGNMQVISAGATLANVLLDIPEMDDAAFRLSNALGQVAGCYDYVFIDCAPTLGHV